MFESLKNTVFWTQTFDSTFQHHAFFFQGFDDYRLAEKRFHWRESLGRRLGLTPQEAVFRALKDFADEFFLQHRTARAERLEELGGALFNVAFSLKFNDQDAYRSIGERWVEYHQRYRDRREVEKTRKQSQTEKVLSHRFSVDHLEEAWLALLAGDVGSEPRSVWRAARSRKSAHDIVKSSLVALDRTMFWLMVFRLHSLVTEEVVMEEHLYCQNVIRDRLKGQLAELVNALDG